MLICVAPKGKMGDTEKRLKQLEDANRSSQQKIELLKDKIEKLESHNQQLEDAINSLVKTTRCQRALHECFLIALVAMATVTLAYAFWFSYHQTTQYVPNYPLDSNLSSSMPCERKMSPLLKGVDWNRLNDLINSVNEKLREAFETYLPFPP